MCKLVYMSKNVGWNFLSMHRWSLDMDNYIHPAPYWACGYLTILGSKLNNGSERVHWHSTIPIARGLGGFCNDVETWFGISNFRQCVIRRPLRYLEAQGNSTYFRYTAKHPAIEQMWNQTWYLLRYWSPGSVFGIFSYIQLQLLIKLKTD